MTTSTYLLSACLLLGAAFVIFRFAVRRDYLRKGSLTMSSTGLEWLIFFSWGFFTYFDLIADPPAPAPPAVQILAWIFLLAGSLLLIIGMVRLGFRRSNGLEVNILNRSGLYGRTRNPQILACLLAVAGYAMLWPSWNTLGWVVLFSLMAHMMVRAEEEHLLDVHGRDYVDYCKRVPRYIRLGPAEEKAVT